MLRVPTDDDLPEIIDLIGGGVHPDDYRPFATPWANLPEPERTHTAMQFIWQHRADFAPSAWRLYLSVIIDGQIVGAQDLMARDFLSLRTVKSGSWLGSSHQGKGIGTEMRAAVLHLAFDGLGASVAETEARVDNLGSLGVTRKLGYEENGVSDYDFDINGVQQMRHFRLTAERWLENRRDDITIEGLEPCLPLFGLSEPDPADAP